MESARQKRCPYCCSEDVIDTGKKDKAASGMNFADNFIAVKQYPVYKCSKCYRSFIYMDESDDYDFENDDFGGGMPY